MKDKSHFLVYLVTVPRALLFIVAVAIFTAVWASAGVISTWFGSSIAFRDFIIRSWSQGILKLMNVHIQVEGKENLPVGGALFVFNHTSYFDIPIFHCSVTDRSVRFGAKIELFKVPFFGPCMRAFGVLPIIRKNREKVLELYRQSIENVHKGSSYILAAEGTRHGSSGIGEKFKAGPFIFAIEGQFPVIPFVLKGSYNVMTPHDLLPGIRRWRHDVKVRILPAISTKGLTLDDRLGLHERVQALMVEAHQQM